LHVRELSKPQCGDSIGRLEARVDKALQPGTNRNFERLQFPQHEGVNAMNGIIYIIGLIVVIAAVLSFFGLR
jgi:hypothetical protein